MYAKVNKCFLELPFLFLSTFAYLSLIKLLITFLFFLVIWSQNINVLFSKHKLLCHPFLSFFFRIIHSELFCIAFPVKILFNFNIKLLQFVSHFKLKLGEQQYLSEVSSCSSFTLHVVSPKAIFKKIR